MIWGNFDDELFVRFLSVVAIVVGLETLVVPVLMKLRIGTGQKKDILVLENVEGDMYRDTGGKMYTVRETIRPDDVADEAADDGAADAP